MRLRLPTRLARSGQTRSRLLVLAVLAAIPITAMAVTIVCQDYEEADRAAEERSAMLEGQVLAHVHSKIAAVILSARESVAKIGGQCVSDAAFTAQGDPTLRLLVLDMDGQERCRIAGPPAIPAGIKPWFEQVRGGTPYSVGTFGGMLAGGAAASDPGAVIAAPATAGLVVAAFMPVTWLHAAITTDGAEPSAAAWLLDGTGRVIASAGNADDATPAAAVFAALTRSRHSLSDGLSATRHRYAYASVEVAGNWRLVVALTAEPEHLEAVHVLLIRSSEFGLLLLGGLVAMVLAADVAFGAPLRRLSEAVGRWQDDGVFAPGSLVGAPDEVQQLARSFTEATTVLRQKQDALARAEEQQSLLVMEVHHRVKNNLQVIASLLNLQASRIRVPEARAEFQAARDRIRALATLHRHLYLDGELHTINMRSFLTELCGQLFQAMGEVEGHRIQLLIEAPELRISSDQAVPLALIVTEAVTNSVKYAFPHERHGKVSVSLTEKAGWIDLVITDDGVGMLADRPGDAECDGIGLRLIRGFSRQLGATLAVEHEVGTRYAVRLPLRSPPPLSALQKAASEGLDASMASGETVAL